jgi:hypothetical protein
MRLWGGRFSKGPDELAHDFTQSLPFDRRLAEHDIAGSIAHVRMLGRCRILSSEDARSLEAGLERVRAGLSSGELALDPASEDIHTEVDCSQNTSGLSPASSTPRAAATTRSRSTCGSSSARRSTRSASRRPRSSARSSRRPRSSSIP